MSATRPWTVIGSISKAKVSNELSVHRVAWALNGVYLYFGMTRSGMFDFEPGADKKSNGVNLVNRYMPSTSGCLLAND